MLAVSGNVTEVVAILDSINRASIRLHADAAVTHYTAGGSVNVARNSQITVVYTTGNGGGLVGILRRRGSSAEDAAHIATDVGRKVTVIDAVDEFGTERASGDTRNVRSSAFTATGIGNLTVVYATGVYAVLILRRITDDTAHTGSTEHVNEKVTVVDTVGEVAVLVGSLRARAGTHSTDDTADILALDRRGDVGIVDYVLNRKTRAVVCKSSGVTRLTGNLTGDGQVLNGGTRKSVEKRNSRGNGLAVAVKGSGKSICIGRADGDVVCKDIRAVTRDRRKFLSRGDLRCRGGSGISALGTAVGIGSGAVGGRKLIRDRRQCRNREQAQYENYRENK